ncbi:MAG: hypothetical protein KatS3mg035_0370 [Bacteroidia bacterium]|nr:MAG: hypothetical protein KatS3mg035_0370 [Bacteroidia bacterium]
MTSGNSFVLPSNSLASQFISTDSGFVALFQNQKLTGSYQFFLVFLNKDLEYQYKIELENASTEFYNNIDYQNDTLRIFSARSNTINDQDVIEYGYRVYNFKQKKVNPAYKKLAVREALPSLNYVLSDNEINPYQYHLIKLSHVYHLYYFQKKKIKSIDYTYVCVKILDTSFNVINYFQKEITSFENISIAHFFQNSNASGMDIRIRNKNETSMNIFYHIKTEDTLWVSEVSSKKYFDKHYLLEKNQSLGITGPEKPEYAYFLNSNSPKDSLLLESVFGSHNYEYHFQYTSKNLAYFPYMKKSPLYSIHNLYITDWQAKRSIMLPYYTSTNLGNEMYVTPVFWDNLCLITGKMNTKNFFETHQNPTYILWNFEKQSIIKDFFFNQPFALILSRPFLKSSQGAYFLGKSKDQFMFYKLEIQP